jgi:hypothetical protein
MSRSELAEFDRCPIRWLRGYRDQENDGMDWGSKIEAPVFGIEKLIGCPEKYINSKGKEEYWTFKSSTCREWRDKQDGPVADFEEMGKLVMAAEYLKEFIDGHPNDYQVMIVSTYHDDATDITLTLKHLLDWMPDDRRAIYDLKTGKSANPDAWSNTVHQRRYDWQAAMEMDAANIALPNADYVEFRHVLQESYPPFHVEEILLSQSWIALGRLNYSSALRKYCQCLKTHEWPGYTGKQTLFGRAHLCEPRPYHLE